MKKFYKFLSIIVLALCIVAGLSGCGRDENEIIIGTMQQPGEPILENIKEAYEAKGYKLKWVLYTDFSYPNVALQEGSIDANLFQHEPFLNLYNQNNSQNLFCAAKLYDCIYGGYTKKNITSVNDIPEGSKISIANDASNLSRCLFILDANGLIGLKSGIATATLDDIESNPKNFQITPVTTGNIANTLNDEDTYLGLVNATFAIAAGLTADELLIKENDPEHVNANILACRSEDKNSQWLKDLVEVLTSKDNEEFILNTFKGTIVPYFSSRLEEE